MSIDFAELHKTARGRVLLALRDQRWHKHQELKNAGGVRYSARVLELKRLGYCIESRPFQGKRENGNEYRLMSLKPGTPQGKRVKVYLEEADADALVKMGKLSRRAKRAVEDALGSFRSNKHKL